VVHLLRRRHELGFVPVLGLIDGGSVPASTSGGAVPLIQPEAFAGEAAGEIDHVFVYMPQVGPDGWERAVNRVRAARIYLIPKLKGQRSVGVQATDLQGTLALSHSDHLLDGRKVAVKRAIDFLLAI